ncbi:MAG: hypothetical protein ABL926_04095, partial [Novosphingobium sp.]
MVRLLAIAFGAIFIMSLVATGIAPKAQGNSVEMVKSGSASAEHSSGRQSARASDGDAMVLERDMSGQFHLTAAVNGDDTRFLVDTGADVV